ncbi:hypothetical protein PFISCL1PPCAC_12838 [Pristionchus fissidentatus]|uniref:Acyl-coenzyme A oxidase n=1 Tax=Pristionchus fissidentatus TaxID=1538716 RepID=A0AAV5VPL7_9BILA|nr:hypothetical protein PFISCL1PPCAC_12838 [Pristionchus fissidentatus]
MLNNYIRPGDNPDLTKERKTCSFDAEELTRFLCGSAEKVERKREIIRIVAADANFADRIPLDFLAREERIDVQARKCKYLMEKMNDLVTDEDEFIDLANEVFGTDGFPLILHLAVFIPVLQSQAESDLVSEYLPRSMSTQVIGAYAQTEMGHGSNLRELETTATFDRATDEFVINTPTRSATKWWPGNMGKMANHAIVTAQLHIDGKNHGPHNFLVQLRNYDDHMPMRGITVGDIGPKMAINTLDNGFLALDHVRIPRRQMLMKHAKVATNGTYTPPIHSKLNYGSMVFVRAHMIFTQARNLCSAVTIATRYSAVRRQGKIDKSSPEVQVLDYQTQQYRIFPQISRAFAYLFTGLEVKQLYKNAMRGLDEGETDLLPDLHALTSGLKSIVSYNAGLAVEQCRMACGEHGYSDASGLPKLYGLVIAGCTYEGENMVMLQQTARYLMKAVQWAEEGKKLSYSIEFMGKKARGRSTIGMHKGDMERENEAIMESIEHMARRLAVDASNQYKKRITGGDSEERAWNGVTVAMNRASRVYSRLFIIRSFHRRVLSSPHSLREVLTNLFSLYLHYESVDMAHHLLHDGHCSGEQIDYLKSKLNEELIKLRPNAVSLVDSFDQSDRLLNSVLGRRDGNVYDALYEWAKSSELNYTEVLPSFNAHIKGIMEADRAKM